MATGRITADDALENLVSQIEACQPSTGNKRRGFRRLPMTDVDGELADSGDRMFDIYVIAQGADIWCWGGESIELILIIVYQNKINHQDIADLKNYLEYHMVKTDGIAGFFINNVTFTNNDVGESSMYTEMSITINYKPPRLQDE